jgi:serine/threonine-protein kinase
MYEESGAVELEEPPLGAPSSGFSALYALERLLGVGATSRVYRARRLADQQPVAVKVLLRGLSAEEDSQLALTEHQLGTRARHPNLLRALDHGAMPDGSAYVVSELLQGETLAEGLRREGGLPVGAVLELFDGLLRGVEALHQCGVVHRDIKPANLYIHHDGGARRMVLVDFAVGQLVGAEAGPIIGTPRYAAPELLSGGRATPATDVYQLCLCIAEALTGLPVVHHLDVASCLKAHRLGRLDLPPALRHTPIGAVLEAGLRYCPNQRPANAGQLRTLLLRAASGWSGDDLDRPEAVLQLGLRRRREGEETGYLLLPSSPDHTSVLRAAEAEEADGDEMAALLDPDEGTMDPESEEPAGEEGPALLLCSSRAQAQATTSREALVPPAPMPPAQASTRGAPAAAVPGAAEPRIAAAPPSGPSAWNRWLGILFGR